MIQTNPHKKGNEQLVSILLAFYVIWKTPFVALYTNTYIAMLLLLALFALLLMKDISYPNYAHAIFGAANVYLLFTLIEELCSKTELLLAGWTAFLAYLPLVLGSLLIYHKMEKQIKMLVPLLLLIYAVTSVTTYLGLQEFPTASRELATGSVNYAPYYARNIGGFTFIYSLVVLHPIFICVLRSLKRLLLCVALSILFGLCIFESKYAIASLTFMISCLSYFIPVGINAKFTKQRVYFVLLFLVTAFFLAPNILLWLSEQEIFADISDKLESLAFLLQGKETSLENTLARQEVYEVSWEAFLSAPILGTRLSSTGISGGHSYILDTMAYWGLAGLAVILFVLKRIARFYRQIAAKTTVYLFVMMSFVLAIVLSALNSMFWPYELGFIIPVMAYYALNHTQKASDETQASSNPADDVRK